MPDGQQFDLSTAANDQDFIRADMRDKIAYLSAHDADFAKAPLNEQMGYLNHIISPGQDPQPQSTYQKLTNPFSPDLDQFSAKHPVLGAGFRLASGAGAAAIGAPEMIYNAFRHPIDASNNLADSIGAWSKPETWKGAPSVLPEALGLTGGTLAASEAVPAVYKGAKAGVNAGIRAAGDSLVDEMGRPKPLPRLVLGNERSAALGEIARPEIADRAGAQEIRSARESMFNDLGQRAERRGIAQGKLDKLAPEPSPFQGMTSSSTPIGDAELPKGNATPFTGPRAEIPGITAKIGAPQAPASNFPKPIRPLVGTPEDWQVHDQQMGILRPEASDAGLYHAARGSASKKLNLQQRIGRKIVEE